MCQRVFGLVAFVTGLVLLEAGCGEPAAQVAPPVDVVPGEVLVHLEEGEPLTALDDAARRLGAYELQEVGAGWVRVRYDEDSAPEQAALVFAAVLGVDAAQPSIVYESDAVPTDPRFAGQYAHRLAEAPRGWDVTQGSREVVVAVIGDGLDLAHEDLVNNLWRNPGEVPGDGVDNDGNGFVDDVAGWDFLDGDNDPGTDLHHETAVAGVLGAEGDNGRGIAGVAWRVSILPLRIQKVSAQLAAAIRYAVDNGARVINVSMSSPSGFRDAAVIGALAHAEANDVVVVGSAGNLGSDQPRYPAAFPQVVGVAATDESDQRAWFSSYGPWVDVAAPGSRVMTTYPGSTYNTAGGTSFAAPYVAGVAALLLAQDPAQTAPALRERLTFSGDALATDQYVGRSRINVAKALRAEASADPCAVACGFEARFSNPRGNAWWVEVDVLASAPLTAVEARGGDGPWQPLAETGWGSWAASFYVPAGALVELRALAQGGLEARSGRYRWPEGTLVEETPAASPPTASPPAASPPALQVAVEGLRGNNWWLEATLRAGEPIVAVEVRVDGGPAVGLSKTSWGPWVGGVRLPDGSRLELRAKGESGAEAQLGPFAWPSGTLADEPGGFEATFSGLRGNPWWVEADIEANEPLVRVEVRVEEGAFQPLAETPWGSWAASLYVPPDALVQLRAQGQSGEMALSTPVPWPP